MSQPPHRPDTPIPPRILERRDSNLISSSPEPLIQLQIPTPPSPLLTIPPNPELFHRQSPPPIAHFENLLAGIKDPVQALSAILKDTFATKRLVSSLYPNVELQTHITLTQLNQ